jgi:hypothetical protein
MAAVTAPARATAITPPWRARARAALATATARGAEMASAARLRFRRPALTIAALGCADASAWHTFGLGAGLLALAGSLALWEWLGSDG